MTENIMQCCYTNAVKENNGKIRSGWQAVVVTEDIPTEAYTNCVDLQNANSTLQAHMVDEQGHVLNLLEIVGDGAYVYVLRTQYGLTDRLGRPNMFSHAYIFSWKQKNILSDPNVFLTLTKDNFAQDEETARQPRKTLTRTEPFTLKRALDRAGLTAETYTKMVRCVYAQYTEKKGTKPLYVQYDGTEEQMQAILYCIYSGLPYSVRRNISVAVGAAGKRNLIFTIEAVGHDSFLVPQTGDNNILTDRIQRRLDRYGFVEYAAQNYETLDIDSYFQRLEQLAAELSRSPDELILKLAHQLIEAPALSELSDLDLDSRLSDALRSKSWGSQRMEEYISSMLEEILNRGMALTEESEINLAERLISPVTERLAETGERYNIYRLRHLPATDATKLLHKLAQPVFDRYRLTLTKTEEGQQLLDQYYAAYGLDDREVNWKTLSSLLTETDDLSNPIKTQDRVDAAAWECYDREITNPDTARNAYLELMKLMKRLIPADKLPKCEAEAKAAYWEKRRLETFSYSKTEEYEAMHTDAKRCYKLFQAVCKVIRIYQQEGDEAFLRELNSFSIRFAAVFTDPQLTEVFCTKLRNELLIISPDAEKLFNWIDIVTHLNAQQIIEEILQLRGMVRDKAFDSFADVFKTVKTVLCNQRPDNVDSIVKRLSQVLMKTCQAADTPENWVPLDVWLTLGTALYSENAFEILDAVNPCVLRAEVSQAADGSKLLKTDEYISQAKEYIQDRGNAFRAVHGWLKERRAIERRRTDEQKKARREADGSMLERGCIFFLQLTNRREAEVDRRDQDHVKTGGRRLDKGRRPAKIKGKRLKKEENFPDK